MRQFFRDSRTVTSKSFLSDDTKVEQNYANQNGALKSCSSEQQQLRSDVKKGKWVLVIDKRRRDIYYILGMLDWTTLVCMITENTVHTRDFFSLLSFIKHHLAIATV